MALDKPDIKSDLLGVFSLHWVFYRLIKSVK